MKRSKKSQTWISAVLYILIMVTAIVIVLEIGIPLLNKLKYKTMTSKQEDFMNSLDQHIVDISNEGQGSQRVIPLELREGEFIVLSDRVYWQLKTKSKLMEQRTYIEKGNLVVSSNVDVYATEDSNTHILRNSYLQVNMSRFGSETNWTSINTGLLINNVMFRKSGSVISGNFNFTIGGNATTAYGNGYTSLDRTGANIDSASVTAHINSSPYEYDLIFTLDSEADFVKTELKNIRVK